jgi:hypothetical protein
MYTPQPQPWSGALSPGWGTGSVVNFPVPTFQSEPTTGGFHDEEFRQTVRDGIHQMLKKKKKAKYASDTSHELNYLGISVREEQLRFDEVSFFVHLCVVKHLRFQHLKIY